MNEIDCATFLLRVVVFWTLASANAGANLVLWYRFDEGSGSLVNDSSGNGNHPSFSGTSAQWNVKPTPPAGGTIHFNPTGSLIAQRTSVDIQANYLNTLICVTGWLLALQPRGGYRYSSMR
jgi:hypothetical protein